MTHMASSLPPTWDLSTDPKPNPFQEPKTLKMWIAISVSAIIIIMAAISVYRCIMARRQQQRQQQQHFIEMVASLNRRVYHIADGDADECSVCLEEFQDQEEVQELPRCGHIFHGECIEECLRYHDECPNCKGQII